LKNHSLRRLFRLRSLLEEVSRVDLEARLQELTRMESIHASMQESRGAMRQRRFAGIVESRNDDWREAQVLDAWLAKEKEMLEAALYKNAREAEDFKAEYFERRKERRQVESIIKAGVHEAAVERGRQDQRQLDDWFGQRSRSKQN
jgi:hypothetical protein